MTGCPNVPLALVGLVGLAVIDDAALRRAGCVDPREVADESFNPVCVLRFLDRHGRDFDSPVTLTFDEFLADNRETLSLSEIQAITDHLASGKPYVGGGGASESWSLERAVCG